MKENSSLAISSWQNEAKIIPCATMENQNTRKNKVNEGIKAIVKFLGVMLRLPFVLFLLVACPLFITTVIIQDYFLAKQ